MTSLTHTVTRSVHRIATLHLGTASAVRGRVGIACQFSEPRSGLSLYRHDLAVKVLEEGSNPLGHNLDPNLRNHFPGRGRAFIVAMIEATAATMPRPAAVTLR